MDIDNTKYYRGGKLYIQGYVYGDPAVQYVLRTDSWSTPIIASSYDRDEIESLKNKLENPYKRISAD
jgi:hypothetical protein